ncbi:protein crumbs homolog 3 isoform X1 [Symphalangus syndactylus]|uniref:protein crumbs homolog 3 isoform X1 n=1 Tax=Symphalangus syndactylus TaxID=9590 RepID=UPI0030049B52
MGCAVRMRVCPGQWAGKRPHLLPGRRPLPSGRGIGCWLRNCRLGASAIPLGQTRVGRGKETETQVLESSHRYHTAWSDTEVFFHVFLLQGAFSYLTGAPAARPRPLLDSALSARLRCTSRKCALLPGE